MNQTKYTVEYTSGFKKDYKRAIKRGLNIKLLEQIVTMLAMGEPLPKKIEIMSYPAIRQAIENVIFCQTGFLFIA